MWGEKFLNAITSKGAHCGGSHKIIEHKGGVIEDIPATYEAIDLVPRDIIIDHWYWTLNTEWENEYLKRGFKVYFSNFEGMIFKDFYERCAKGISGISISNWSLLNLDHMQRNLVLFGIAHAAKLMEGTDLSYEQTCIEVSEDLYSYRTRNFKNILEITHRTDIKLEHKMFVDGYMIDKEGDYLGKYEVTFTDNTSMEIPVYYGLNIGSSDVTFANEASEARDGTLYMDSHLLEPTYSCSLVKDKNGIFYKYGIEIPEGKEIKDTILIQDSKHGKTITTKEIKLKR